MPKKKRNTGIPKIRQLPSGAYHTQVYDYTDDNGKRQFKYFTNYDYTALMAEVVEFKAKKKDDHIRQATNGITLKEAVDRYINSKSAVLSPSTIKNYKRIAKTKFTKLMPISIYDITTEMLQVAINSEAAECAPKTVRNDFSLISSALKVYRPEFSPTLKYPQKKKTEIQIPTTEEVSALMTCAHGTRMELPLILAACCGMRRSEISALTWTDIDFKKETLKIDKAVVYDEDNHLVEKPPKTESGERTIKLFPLVTDALQRAYSQNTDEERICSIPSVITRGFERLLKRAGVKHYRFHDLRHYACSVMLGLGIPKPYIADYLGHESERMIDEVYGHIMKDMKTKYEENLNNYYKGAFPIIQHETISTDKL